MMLIADIIQEVKDLHIVIQVIGVLLVAAAPFLEGYVAVPIGIAIGLPLLPIIAAAIVSNWLSVMAVIIGSNQLKHWLKTRKNKKELADQPPVKRMQRGQQLFNKYGVPGVALIGSLLIGNHIGAFISMVSGAEKRHVILWQTISIVLWAAGSGVLVYWGLYAIRS